MRDEADGKLRTQVHGSGGYIPHRQMAECSHCHSPLRNTFQYSGGKGQVRYFKCRGCGKTFPLSAVSE